MDRHMQDSGPAVIFLGPTLSREEAERTVGGVYLPPAEQGSVLHAVRRFQPRAILMIDGTFQSAPAVRHKEILWAIAAGIPVIGAASMGALRAAELAPHMLGVGLIYRWYRRFPFAPDDAVAVVHGPAELNSVPLSQALVDLRMTFRSAQRRGVLTRATRTSLEAAAARLNFRDRTLARVMIEAGAPHQDSSGRDMLDLLSNAYVAQKKADALLALDLLRRGTPRAPSNMNLALTATFARELEQAGIQPI
jgi:hypothetical protein